MITKEFTIFYYEQFLYLKNYSPLSTSLFFLRNSLVLFPCPPPSSFWGLLCIIFSKSFFFFRKREDSFSSIISSFVSIFHLLSFSLSLPPLSKSKTSFDIFIPRLSRFPPFSHFFGRRGGGERGASWTLRDPFALISLKFSKWTTSREKKASKRGRGRGRDSSPPRR